ncbi:MAG TPA: ATP-binding protein [Actinomycetota bacterium]|nr:ATP-binding protein [Actinomycetota bacterium]
MSSLEDVVAGLRDAIIVLDAQRRVVSWLGSAERLLGWSAAEAEGQLIDELLLPKDANGNPACFGPCEPRCVLPISRGTPEQELLVETRSHRELWLGVCCSFERGPDNHVTQIVASARDVTRRKRIDLAKSEVISAVSHELRSPLTSVKGFTSTLLHRWDRFDDDTKKHLLVTIESDADRVTRLIGELLDVSRIEAGRLQLQRYPIDVTEVAEKVVGRLTPTAEHHSLSCSFPSPFPQVYADPDKIEQVLTNLVENALKHTDAGHVAVGGALDGTRVRVTVADQGEGIPKEHRLAVFGKFFRRAGRAGAPSGTGLGLYISKGLVEAHGGRIWVEAPEAGGSVFAFTLPVAEPEAAGE